MKRILLCITVGMTLVLSSCADDKTFVIDGKETVVEPYGWFDTDAKNDSVHYKICVGNVVWSVLLSETVVAPIVITGVALWEPVRLEKSPASTKIVPGIVK
jgi:hypothetical protein